MNCFAGRGGRLGNSLVVKIQEMVPSRKVFFEMVPSRKVFFFEEKKQKTFMSLAQPSVRGWPPGGGNA
jgi:hypothetical protein